ncbi:MAG: hypothetical protein D6718_03875 [Acidobacteria bacterium]|nr:MAG: hypothetical protein D6718_03875 [Acidobacteriota bacterium]
MRRFLIAVAAAAVLLAAGVLLAVRLVDVQRYRPRIERAVLEATGWRAELGDLRLSLWRGLALTARPVTLRAPGGETRADVALLAVEAELWPLLRGDLIVRRIEIDRPAIDLVRRDPDRGWAFPAAVPASAGSEPGIRIDEIQVKGGRIALEDRTADPPARVAFEDVAAVIMPETGRFWGTAHAAGGLGRVKWNGTAARGFRIDIEALRTEVLRGWLGPLRVREGGMLSGSVEIAPDFRISGSLRGDGLGLETGEAPLERARFDFDLVPEAEGWSLARGELAAGDARIRIEGRLDAEPRLTARLPSTPLEDALALVRSLFPLPIAIEPPGTASLVAELSGGDSDWEARASGTLSAERVVLGNPLPPVEKVALRFDLADDGELRIRIDEGEVAGGSLTGSARVEALSGPGKVRFEGRVGGAELGRLLAPMLPGVAGKVSGPLDLRANVQLDLQRGPNDLAALSGTARAAATGISAPGWDLEAAVRRAVEARLEEVARKAGLLERFLKGRPEAPPAPPEARRLVDRLAAAVDLGEIPWRLAPFEIEVGRLTASGRGRFDPRDGGIALDLTGALSAEASAEIVAGRPALRRLLDPQGRLVVPLRVRGTVTRPAIGVDASGLVDDNLADALREELTKDATGEEARGLIERLLRRRRERPQNGGGG